MANSFLYFAYGSNLLTKRIRINNPTAIKKDIGRLKNFRLDFITFSKRWHGAAATIVPTENSHVWGVIWEIDNSNMSDLDEQEGVADKIYFPMTVDVETPNGTSLQCRVYQQCKNPEENVTTELLPEERRPSPLYLNTILSGARENGLPHEYIQFLQSIPHNGYSGESEISLPLREQ
ncbi:gamma-glutamylcyclotransferase [Cephus cinctus]|uniref:gamma-glutamylcyclotransferase n=1 Tax=Cephus cinctus TaxID=211228 RepID=A0AAJ7BW32_CEPCN|nr:gamma-glutamylcyclotransferase [Cephus cinctus]